MDDISIIISPTNEILETDSFAYTPSSYSLDDFSLTSPTDEISETDSFKYNPSLASSETSIPSYKTERTINSRKSRYNALPRHKYAGIGPPNSHVPSGVDVPKVSYLSPAYGQRHYRHFSGCVWTAPRRVNALRRCWSFAGGGTERDTD